MSEQPEKLKKIRSEALRRPAIKRLARKGGIKRLSGNTYAEVRNILDDYLRDVVKDAVIVTQHAKRKTVTSKDVNYALTQNKRPVYM